MSKTPPALQTYKSKLGANLGAVSVCTVWLMVFVMGLVKIYSPDLGFHLKSAAWILNNKKFIYTDSFSYGSAGHPYYDLQWMFQLLVFFLYQLGQPVLVVTNALLISCSVALAWLRFSKYPTAVPAHINAAAFSFIALLFVLPLTFEVRPHVLSWLYLNLVLLALESYKRGKHKAVYFLPVLMLFWVNTHSLSILGLAVIAIYNAGFCFEQKRTDKKLLLFSVLAFAAFLVNPYFLNGLLFPFKQFGLISGNGLTKLYIGEFHSPFAANELSILRKELFSNPVLLLQYISPVVAIFCLVRSFLQKNFIDALLLGAFIFLFSLALKNYGYYLMTSLPLMARYITGWLGQQVAKHKKTASSQKEKNRQEALAATPAFSKKVYNGMAAATISLSILISITCINDGYTIFLQVPDRFGFSTDKDQLPVDAAGFLVKNNIKGKVLNHLNFGGYLMAHTNAKVFIDGRLELIDNDFFGNYYYSVTEENGVKGLLDTFKPDIVIFPYESGGTWWPYFLANKSTSGYKPVYFDGLSVIYLRSSAFPQIPELTAQGVLKDLDITAVKQLDALIRMPDKPHGAAAWLQSTWKKQRLPAADIRKAIFCFANGFDTAALVYTARTIEQSTVHVDDVIYTNLSVYYRQKNMLAEAQLCEDKISEDKPE